MTERFGVICAGNWIVDQIHEIDRWPNESELVRIGQQTQGIGGGAANVMFALAKLEAGLQLFPMGAIGQDAPGEFILNACRKLGLPTSGLCVKSGVATAHTHVMSVAGQSRTFFYQSGANDALSETDFPAGTFASTPARVFYLGYLTLLGELDETTHDGSTNAAQVLARARQAGLTTCVDLVSIQHPRFQQIVASSAPHIDYLISNEIEAAFACGSEPNADADAVTAMAKSLLELKVKQAVIVHSAERVVWVGADGSERVVEIDPINTDDIVSNLGAGDAFCAGLIYGIHQGLSVHQTIQIAILTAKASLKGLTATSAIPPLTTLVASGLEPLTE
ncbi:MAG: carbohydrate kinase family protein [Pseudomonadota bacterium]